ncbi:MAG: c-type cytochrome domain-containing protein [Bacteroidales bacterium]|nr:c-type cytochrome domain-containing protein [Bacteroidales bacterium]
MQKILFLTLISLFIFWSCTHEPSQTVEPASGNNNGGDNGDDSTQVAECDPDTVYFKNEILPLLQSSCGTTGCHDAATATDGVILTDYENIMNTGDVEPFDAADSDIYEMITDNEDDERMPPPPNSRLSQEKIDRIAAWINQGALNNGCEQADCDTVNVSYAETIAPVFESFCVGCHDEATANGGVVIETYDQREMVASSGALHGVINGTDGYPQMPPSNTLPGCEKAQIEKWISDGAPNN